MFISKTLKTLGLAMLSSLILASVAHANNPFLNKRPPLVTLQGEQGARLGGAPWSSAELKGKVFVFMYVDPDAYYVNTHVEEFLANAGLPESEVKSVGVINMGASVMPQFLMDPILASKQKDYPNSVYVQDLQKVLIKQWKLADNDYNVLVFNRQGAMVFQKGGKLSQADMDQLMKVIKAAI